jgi:hypothetical protein
MFVPITRVCAVRFDHATGTAARSRSTPCAAVSFAYVSAHSAKPIRNLDPKSRTIPDGRER